MKINIISIVVLLVSLSMSVKAQVVGIGTENPQGVFHIDAQKNTSGGSNTSDDVIVDSDGKVGIGKLDPAEKLDVTGNVLITGNATIGNNLISDSMKYAVPADAETLKSQLDIKAASPGTGFRLDDGTQTGLDIPILATEISTGNTFWTVLPSLIKEGTDIVTGIIRTGSDLMINTTSTNAGYYYDITKDPLVLGEGIWLICAKILIHTDNAAGGATNGTNGYMAYMYLGDGTASGNGLHTGLINTAVTGTIPETSGYRVGILQISCLYNNTSGGNKTIRAFVRTDRYTTTYPYQVRDGAYWTDPYFFAIKLDYTNPL